MKKDFAGLNLEGDRPYKGVGTSPVGGSDTING
jgi:hypothetical protein